MVIEKRKSSNSIRHVRRNNGDVAYVLLISAILSDVGFLSVLARSRALLWV